MFCAKCGVNLTSDTTFCGGCGHKVASASQAGAPPIVAANPSPKGHFSGVRQERAGTGESGNELLPLAIFIGILVVIIAVMAAAKHGLMINAILTALVAVSALWVYLDATANSIGKIPEKAGGSGMWNLSANGWGWSSLLLWIVAVPAYVLKRPVLIVKARAHPVTVANRTAQATTLAGVGALWVVVVAALYFSGTVPSCDSKEVVALADKVVKDSPMSILLGSDFQGLSMPAEESYSAEHERRVCRAMITVAGQQAPVEYSVEWHDKSKGLIFVQFLTD